MSDPGHSSRIQNHLKRREWFFAKDWKENPCHSHPWHPNTVSHSTLQTDRSSSAIYWVHRHNSLDKIRITAERQSERQKRWWPNQHQKFECLLLRHVNWKPGDLKTEQTPAKLKKERLRGMVFKPVASRNQGRRRTSCPPLHTAAMGCRTFRESSTDNCKSRLGENFLRIIEWSQTKEKGNHLFRHLRISMNEFDGQLCVSVQILHDTRSTFTLGVLEVQYPSVILSVHHCWLSVWIKAGNGNSATIVEKNPVNLNQACR